MPNEDEELEKFKNYIKNFLVGVEKQVDVIYAGIEAARLSNTIPAFLLQGPPGAGKTAITKVIADFYNAEYTFVQATLNTSEDELIYKYVPSENAKSGVKILYGPLPEALIKSKEKLTVLVIDEFDKTRPSTDALLLDYLQNCRISFRIDETENLIEGNRKNLIVFLTSNDAREFSEPLLRRVITINFLPPSPQAVEEILEKHFKDNKKIIKILTKIYAAGLNAGLNKPITIQELIQFGHALQVMPNGNFNELLYSFVVKSYEDMEKLNEALNNAETKQTQAQENIPDVTQALVQHQEEQEPQELQEQEEKQEHSVTKVLASIKVPKEENIVAEKSTENEERTFSTNVSNDFKEYSTIIKTFELAPADRPDILGTFQVVIDNSTLKLTALKPLTLLEVQKLTENNMSFEAYIEDSLYFQDNYHDIIDIVKRNNLNFMYYTRNLIIAKNDKIILRLEKIHEKHFNAKMYMKYTGEDKKLLNYLLVYQQDVVLKKFLETLRWRENEIMNGKFFNSNEYMQLKEFLEVTGIDAKLIIEPYQQLFIAIGKGTTEVRYVIDYEISSNFIKFIIKRLDIATEKTINSDNIKNIINKYVGTYELLDGLNQLKRMAEEIKNFVGGTNGN